jgi:hypothetical protein
MLTQLLLTTVLLPLVLGVMIALPGTGSTKNLALTALLIPIAAAIASVAIEGLPAFPPVAAKQKLPVLLLGGGIIFAGLAVVLKKPLRRRVAALVSVLSLAVPAWWLGRNVLLANPTKAATLAVVLVIVALELFVVASSRSRKPAAAALPAALIATAIGTALTAITGGYIGMAQMNGALAALIGGWLLVRYIAYLRGNDDAFGLQGMAAFSFAWTAAAAVAMTVLFAPSASPAALVLCVLPTAVFIALGRADFAHQPRALRPLISGGLAALPAIIAILIAVLNEG